ncbi:unnamed protein product [Orchesella dallaii]|uniref:Uncharacterized protein n=1 Tax=Orchesella dallaii TaxID=48710 RepID=A0ABP1Q3F2_9HEXA
MPSLNHLSVNNEIVTSSGKFYTEEFHSDFHREFNIPSEWLMDTWRNLEKFVYLNCLRGFYEVGWTTPQLNTIFKEADLLENFEIGAGHMRHFVSFICQVMEAEGILENENHEKEWKVVKLPPSYPDALKQLNSSDMKEDLVSRFAPTALLSKVGESLAGFLKGTLSPLSILFPDENKTKEYPSLADFYTDFGGIAKVTDTLQVNERVLDQFVKSPEVVELNIKTVENDPTDDDEPLFYYNDLTISEMFMRTEYNETEGDVREHLRRLLKVPKDFNESIRMSGFQYYIQQISKCDSVFIDRLSQVSRMRFELAKLRDIPIESIATSIKFYGRYYESWTMTKIMRRPGDPHSQIWLTSALTDSDVSGALTLCFSLKKLLTTRKIGVIVSKKVGKNIKEFLRHTFDFFFDLDEERNPVELKEEDFVKVFTLSLKPFEKCVFLAPTMMAIKNCDEIFDNYDSTLQGFLSVEEKGMDIFVVQPSLQKFNSLMSSLRPKNGKGVEAHIRCWIHSKTKTEFLPAKYNCLITPQKVTKKAKNPAGIHVSIVNLVWNPLDLEEDKLGLFEEVTKP